MPDALAPALLVMFGWERTKASGVGNHNYEFFHEKLLHIINGNKIDRKFALKINNYLTCWKTYKKLLIHIYKLYTN